MASNDLSPDLNFLEKQFKAATDRFNQAISRDVELGELKKIFSEMKTLKTQIENLSDSSAAKSIMET